jgi:hypothetical protein
VSADEIFVVVLMMFCVAVVAVIAIRSRQQQDGVAVDRPAAANGSRDARGETVRRTAGSRARGDRSDA